MTVPRKIQCTVDKIVDHGAHVYTLRLSSLISLPAFKPGQFLHLALDPYDPGSFWPESRIFSIASSPEERNYLTIVYSVRGQFTSRMENKIYQGSKVWVKLPYGDFFVDATQPAVLIAGGTGITAFTSFLYGISAKSTQPVIVVYGARSPELLILSNLTDRCKRLNNNFHVYYFVEALKNYNSGLIIGSIDINRIWPEIQRIDISQFYLSGPPIMVKTITNQLIDKGILDTQIHVDAWE